MVDARTFDLFASDEALEYPTDTLTVHRNRAAVYKWQKLRAERDKTANSDSAERLENEMALYEAKIKKSALHLEMKALPPQVLTSITESVPASDLPEDATQEQRDAADNLRNRLANERLFEAMLVRITNSEGEVAEHPGARTGEWLNSLPPEIQQAILGKMGELAFASLEFAAETESADF